MPIFDYHCINCGNVWESVEVWQSHRPKFCPQCQSTNFERAFSSLKSQQIRMDADVMKHTLPDPVPPLEELRGKGSDGYSDKPEADLRHMKRRKDKYGNTIWEDKKTQYFIPKI